MAANYELEGIITETLSDSTEGKWLRDNAVFLVLPFMDKDGVEDGDQGKNRKPHDHNRDYGKKSIHREVKSLKPLVKSLLKGKKLFALDLHCPYLKGGEYNENIYLVGKKPRRYWCQIKRFGNILEKIDFGSLQYSNRNNLPYGKSWNTSKRPRSFSWWTWRLPGALFAGSLEFPYANVGRRTVTPASARKFGTRLARAIKRYLE